MFCTIGFGEQNKRTWKNTNVYGVVTLAVALKD